MRNVKAFVLGNGGRSLLAALALSACGSMQRPPMERILQEGDCATVPAIEHLAITVSDHGSKVAFAWSGQRFAGTVQTSAEPLAPDASYGVNRSGEWEKRFPGISATDTVADAYLGFPAFADPGAGVFVATVFPVRYPGPSDGNRAVAVVDLKTNDTVLLPAPRRVASLALSPKADYVAVVETAPSTAMSSWRDVFSLSKGTQSPRFDAWATIYSTSGLVACTRELATRLPSTVANVAWR